MTRKEPTIADMLEYAHAWVDWFDVGKRTATLFRDCLLQMDNDHVFDLDAYNTLVDRSSEREETRVDGKKMARVLFHYYVWDEELVKEMDELMEKHKKNDPFKNMEIVKCKKGDGVKF